MMPLVRLAQDFSHECKHCLMGKETLDLWMEIEQLQCVIQKLRLAK